MKQKETIQKIIQEYKTNDDAFWKEEGEKSTLGLFQEMAARVPAYKDVLRKHKIVPHKITSIDALKEVPVIDKPTYIDEYPIQDLCWDGKIETSYMLSASSGSTGKPYFWPRSIEQTDHGKRISELVYHEYFQMDITPTLYIVAFGMGTWIAGTYMMMSTLEYAKDGNPVTVVTPGINKDEILRLIDMGAKSYKQIILVGYPPFVKDVIDTGIERGVKWKDIPVKFMFSAEAFTEGWRDHLQKKVGFPNIFTDTINIYGSADVGLNAHETVSSIFLRRISREKDAVRNALFHTERIPAIYQFDPRLRYFEKLGDELLVSTRSGIPLLRYNTKDVGDVLPFGAMKSVLSAHEVDFDAQVKKEGVSSLIWTLPFVYLFGRGKFTATIYGITIFPEFIKIILDHPELEKRTTGKFVLSTEETPSHDQELHMHIELNENTSISQAEEKQMTDTIIHELAAVSSEYRHLLSNIKQKAHPIIIFHEYGDTPYFPRGIMKKTA